MRWLVGPLALFIIWACAAPAAAQSTLVILSPNNSYSDEVEPGVVLMRGRGAKGPLESDMLLEFSCGTCDVATFSDAVPTIGGGTRVCGLRPEELVTLDVQVCMRSTVSGDLYDFDLLTWDSNTFPCVDADGGVSCASTGGYGAYIRSKFDETADPLTMVEQLIQGIASADLPQGTENSLLAKLDGAWKKLSDTKPNNDGAAVNKLEAFVNEVLAQRGKKIPAGDADAWIAAAQSIVEILETS